MKEQDPAKYFWMGAAAVLAGITIDRALRAFSGQSLTKMAYTVREIKNALAGGPAETVVITPPDTNEIPDEALPPSYRRDFVPPKQSAEPYFPPGEVIPLTEEEDAVVEANAIFQQMTEGSAIDVDWQYT